jgi:hypothetical protein
MMIWNYEETKGNTHFPVRWNLKPILRVSILWVNIWREKYKQEESLSPLLLKHALDTIIRKIRKIEEGLQLARIHQLLICADGGNYFRILVFRVVTQCR